MGFRMPLTLDERKEIKRLLPSMSCTQIAARLNRSKNSVVTDVRINGGKEDYDPKKAHERAVVVHRRGVESMMEKQKIAANDYENKQRYDHCKSLIHGLQNEIDEIRRNIQIILGHQAKPVKAKVFSDGRRASNIERRLKALEERYLVKKPHSGESLPDDERLIYASEWEKYHNWPNHSLMMGFIRDRAKNGFEGCCLKIGKRWMVDEGKLKIWARSYKEKMLKQAKEKQ